LDGVLGERPFFGWRLRRFRGHCHAHLAVGGRVDYQVQPERVVRHFAEATSSFVVSEQRLPEIGRSPFEVPHRAWIYEAQPSLAVEHLNLNPQDHGAGLLNQVGLSLFLDLVYEFCRVEVVMTGAGCFIREQTAKVDPARRVNLREMMPDLEPLRFRYLCFFHNVAFVWGDVWLPICARSWAERIKKRAPISRSTRLFPELFGPTKTVTAPGSNFREGW